MLRSVRDMFVIMPNIMRLHASMMCRDRVQSPATRGCSCCSVRLLFASMYAACMRMFRPHARVLLPCLDCLPDSALVPASRCLRPWQVCRGTAVMLVAPSAGMEEISNPFLAKEEEAE